VNENEALCCFGLLRMRGGVERVLEMLPDARREAARRVLEECSTLPEPELIKRLAEVRRREPGRHIGPPHIWTRRS
jgi:hypothetical protein